MKEKYTNAIGQLQKDVGASNVMQVPRIEKVVVNVGIGRISKESDKVKEVFEAVESIVGQTPIKTKAQRSIAGFKVREGQDVGIKVTLRGDRMWDFLTRLVGVALPRVRDFQGIALTAIDQNGNLNIGITDHTVFPEIIAEQVKHVFGLQVSVVTTAKNKDDAKKLYETLGFPLQKEKTKEKKTH